jgi:hypothetical protein
MAGIETYLKQEFPEATEAECRRFVSACRQQYGSNSSSSNNNNNKNKSNAEKTKNNDVMETKIKMASSELLQRYLDWRNVYNMDYNANAPVKSNSTTPDYDYDKATWDYAVQRTLEIQQNENEKEEQKKQQQTATETTKVSQFLFVHRMKRAKDSKDYNNQDSVDNDTDGIVDRHGYQILHVLPALIDKSNVSSEMYAMILIFYLDQLLDRSSETKMTVVLDVRPGNGWPNSAAIFMVNYIRKITSMLQGHFPGKYGLVAFCVCVCVCVCVCARIPYLSRCCHPIPSQ